MESPTQQTSKKTSKSSLFTKIFIVLLLGGLFWAIQHFQLTQYLSLEYLKSKQEAFRTYYEQNQLQTISLYMVVYILSAALSLPGATILTLAGGALFGFWTGLILVSFASTIGATLAFLVARFLLRDFVQTRFGDKLRAINDGIQKDGAFYLFTLRLIPAFPFFVINLAMGLTPIKIATFYGISQIGMLAGTAVYVNAGTQLAQINSLKGILSPNLIVSFALLGIFPLIARKVLKIVKSRKYLKEYIRPKHFDFNTIVVGAGSAGLVSAYLTAAFKGKVALIERNKMGGDCLNTGCVPSKALIKSARILSYAKRAKEFGFNEIKVDFEFSKVMERVQRVIKAIEPHDSVERYTGLGVDCFSGSAKILSPYEVELTPSDSSKDKEILTARNIIVATGARPFIPPIPGLESISPKTSDTIWEIRELPKKLVVLGGGPIGSELTQCFARFGSQVTQIEMAPRILPREDEEVSTMVMEQFKKEGIEILAGYKAIEFKTNPQGQKVVVCEREGSKKEIEFDEVLVAIGRKANVEGFGLEEMDIRTTEKGTLEVDDYLRTNYPNIYGCGDVAGPYQFTHTAAHMAFYAAWNSTFGSLWDFKVDYSVIPWATFTDPEVAQVGLNEQAAKEKGIAYEVTTYGIDDLDRAIADEEAHGMVKVLTIPGSDKILGATIVGDHAGDIIVEFVAAMKNNFGLGKILGTIHIYPTWGEANKYVAGNWRKARSNPKVMKLLERFNTRQRGQQEA